MILERDGKYFKKVEVEEEISEIEYLKLKIAELEEKIAQRPIVAVYPTTADITFPDTITSDHLYRPWLVTY